MLNTSLLEALPAANVEIQAMKAHSNSDKDDQIRTKVIDNVPDRSVIGINQFQT